MDRKKCTEIHGFSKKWSGSFLLKKFTHIALYEIVCTKNFRSEVLAHMPFFPCCVCWGLINFYKNYALKLFIFFSDSVRVDFRRIHYQCHAIKWASLYIRPRNYSQSEGKWFQKRKRNNEKVLKNPLSSKQQQVKHENCK